jgi:hypothetical protein
MLRSSLRSATMSLHPFVAKVKTALALFFAAGAAARAIRVHHQPDEAPLRVLGMKGVSFKPYL